MTESPRCLVSLCTYNERENVERLVPEIHQHLSQADVVVVDDDSPDGTGRLVDEMAAQDERVKAVHRVGERGLGTATLAAFRYAIEHDYDLLLNMDADFSHPPRYLPDLVAAMDGADVAIGSRYVKGGKIEGWGFLRHFSSTGINLYSRCLLGLKPKDCSGAFRCYRVSKLAELDLQRVRSTGYSFQEEILYRCKRAGCRFTEVPITFEERRYGSSKIDAAEAFTALWVLFVLALENLRGVPVTKQDESALPAQTPND